MKDKLTCSKMTLEKLEHELKVVFNNDLGQINQWLDTPIPRLDGECPRSLLKTDVKREKLFQVLQEMKFGEMA